MKRTTITTGESFEEVGRSGRLGIDVEITWHLWPGEPMVRYYPDGSGYPGSPPMAEPVDVRVTSAWGDGWTAVRRHPRYPRDDYGGRLLSRPDWLDGLAEMAWQLVDDNLDSLADSALEGDLAADTR